MECRLCLNTNVNQNIFDLKYVVLQPFLCLLKIGRGDGLSQMVCNRCISKISPMETFYKKCKEVDLYLRSKVINNEKTDKTELKIIKIEEQESSDEEDKSLFEIFFKDEQPFNNKTVTDKTHSSVDDDVSKKEQNENNSNFKTTERKYVLTSKMAVMNHFKSAIKTESESNFCKSKKEDLKFKNESLNVEYDDYQNNESTSDDAIKVLTTKKQKLFANFKVEQKRQISKLFCPVCNIKLSSIPLYVRHVRTHSGVLTCKLCGFPYLNKQSLRKHILKIHYCTYCRKYFKDKRPHERIEHDDSFTPVFPEEKIVNEKREPEVHLCPICGSIVKCIVKHMEIHSNASFKCGVCSKMFVTKFRLQQHTKIHYNQRNFECDYCGNKYKSRHTLILHIKGVHLKSYMTNCPICGKVFNGRGYMKEHLKRHMGDKRFICKICSDGFVTARSLRDHITKHSTDRPYICAYCPKAFKTKEGSKRHEKIHKGVTPHKCPICYKGFIQRANMKSHFKYNHKGMDFEKEDAQFKSINGKTNECYFTEPLDKT